MRRSLLLLAVLALVVAACTGPAGPVGPEGPQGVAGPAGPQGPAGENATFTATDLTCTECHNDGGTLTGKTLEWEMSGHGEGTAYLRGTSASCAGCHAGQGFTARIAAGISNPDDVAAGEPDPTKPDCRACHEIHTTYTSDDFALTTTDAVDLYASGQTFDMGMGNLCANCHQPRRELPAAAADGTIEIDSTHWGPHHGPQSTMLMGIGGSTEGSQSAHYQLVADGCPACHMGDNANHSFEPDVANCEGCHSGLDTFDYNGVQTAVKDLYAQLGAALQGKGLLDENLTLVPGSYPAAQAAAAWDYEMIGDDGSWGVHNPDYIQSLLTADIAALK
jgi:hypothetical protein